MEKISTKGMSWDAIKELRKKLKNKEPLLPHEKIPEKLAEFLGRKYGYEIRVVPPREIRNNLGLYDRARHVIFLSEKVFSEQNKEGHEHTLFHELGHFLDNEVSTTKRLSMLDREAVAELFYYLILAGGDIVSAEKDAREGYKSARSAWLYDYQEHMTKKQEDTHVQWGEARKRALELYGSKVGQEICRITGWLPPKEVVVLGNH
ncbi:MAG: hypothetical protein HZA35_03375 [Parcubacteria group bacterium]|nr:hypothetical protein [Parcubacteria group bacterium]